MGTYHRLTDNILRRAPHAIAGIFATIVLCHFLRWLWPLLVVETVAAFVASLLLAGRTRLMESLDALGFARYRDYLVYTSFWRGLPLGTTVVTAVAAVSIYAALSPLDPASASAMMVALLFSLSVAEARRRWPADTLEKAGDR